MEKAATREKGDDSVRRGPAPGTSSQLKLTMKAIKLIRGALVLVATLAISPFANAQQTTVTTTSGERAVAATSGERIVTTTRVGRVGTITPDSLMMDAAAGTEPIPYVRTTRTVYVDDTGAVIPADTVRVGTPVTVHYTRDADRYLADRVVVHRQAVVNPAPAVVEKSTVIETPARKPAVIEKKTTTTTTTVEPTKKVVVDEDDNDDDD
jgi:hypothetical protein